MWKCKLICCIGLSLLCTGTNVAKPVHQLSGTRNNDAVHHYLHRRQINPQFQASQFGPAQFYQAPFDENSNGPFNQPAQLTQDEETRFFLSGRERTTLNPLAFPTPPPSTTQHPFERQQQEEQRRFQEEIANRALREQQERDLGLTPPPQPSSTPLPNPANPFDEQSQLFFQDPAAAANPTNPDPFAGQPSQPFFQDASSQSISAAAPPNANPFNRQSSQAFFQNANDQQQSNIDFLPSPEFSPFVQPDPQLYGNNERNYRFAYGRS